MAIVLNDLLGVPGLKIYQDTDYLNFSLDSILLASFVKTLRQTKKIVDLGTGNGPILLYLTLKTKALMTGIEIQSHSYELALKSVKENNKEDQISLYNKDIKNINQIIGKNIYDIVISNPPFYKLGEARLNDKESLNIAKHEVLITLEDIIKEASLLLKNGGSFYLVHRPSRLCEIFSLLSKYHLEPKRMRLVYPKVNKSCNHVLIEAKKNVNPASLIVLEPLIVYNNNDKWTDEVLNIYNGKEI